jgi:catechol 2,3-dioxygenase-like lactoylglutathione lyase family enzyme
MKKPLFRKIDCVMLYVPDLEEAIAFYQDRLGHRLAWRIPDAAGLKMPDTDAEIVLQTGQRGMEVDFLVPSADEAAREFEMAGGMIVVPPFDIQIGRCVVVKDPWDHTLVLLDTSKGRLITDKQGNVIGNEPPV